MFRYGAGGTKFDPAKPFEAYLHFCSEFWDLTRLETRFQQSNYHDKLPFRIDLSYLHDDHGNVTPHKPSSCTNIDALASALLRRLVQDTPILEGMKYSITDMWVQMRYFPDTEKSTVCNSASCAKILARIRGLKVDEQLSLRNAENWSLYALSRYVMAKMTPDSGQPTLGEYYPWLPRVGKMGQAGTIINEYQKMVWTDLSLPQNLVLRTPHRNTTIRLDCSMISTTQRVS